MSRTAIGAVVGILVLMSGPRARAADSAGPDAQEVRAVVEKAAGFLKGRQGADGSFSPRIAGPGVTALVVAALLRNGYSTDDSVVRTGLAYLEKSVKKDGGIYDRKLANYTTCVALMAFQDANRDGRYDTIIKNGSTFLKKLQKGGEESDPQYGGTGYDKTSRADLSNTQFFIDAMLAAGVPRNDPAIQRALKFVSRCQNLPGETNDQPFARKTSDDDRGGLTYLPLDSDDNPHRTSAGGLRSLGAMTYGGLKSFLYAGVGKGDPRVKAAIHWIQRHYTLDENPGMKQAGLYYYYHTLAKAMAALEADYLMDADGVKHDWRRDLFAALKKRQGEEGGFVNKGDRTFGEADPNLATAFALLALSYMRPAMTGR